MNARRGSSRAAAQSGLAWLAAALLWAGCSNPGPLDVVYYQVRPDVDFEGYRTFALGPYADEDEMPPEAVRAYLGITHEAVRAELLALGLREVEDPADADLQGAALIAAEEEAPLTWACVEEVAWWGQWPFEAEPCPWLAQIEVTYTPGSVVVVLVDPALAPSDDHGRVPFGGVLSGVADGSGTPQDRIDDAVQRLFDRYPVELPTSE